MDPCSCNPDLHSKDVAEVSICSSIALLPAVCESWWSKPLWQRSSWWTEDLACSYSNLILKYECRVLACVYFASAAVSPNFIRLIPVSQKSGFSWYNSAHALDFSMIRYCTPVNFTDFFPKSALKRDHDQSWRLTYTQSPTEYFSYVQCGKYFILGVGSSIWVQTP